MQNLNIKEICKKCNHGNEVESADIKTMFGVCEGKEYRVLYFRCDSCCQVNVVQVDNDFTLKILEKLKSLTIEAAKKNVSHEEIPKKWIGKRNALNNRLTSERKKLMKKLEGKEIENLDKDFKIII